jgi:ribonuclease P protein component
LPRSSSLSDSQPADRHFPKSVRILRSSDYRKVYDQGFRVPCRALVGFCLRVPGLEGKKVGYTTSRALGKAVVRNRIRRRLKEAVRLRLHLLAAGWMVVFNARRTALVVAFPDLLEDVERVFSKCRNS